MPLIKDKFRDDLVPLPKIPAPLTAVPRLHFVDSLGGLAMLMVLLYHCRLNGGEWGWTPFGPYSVNFAAPFGYGFSCVFERPFMTKSKPAGMLRGRGGSASDHSAAADSSAGAHTH